MKTCSRCKSKVPVTSRFCKYCGSSDFLGADNTCQFCDAPLPDRDVNFCPVCGRRINEERQSKQRRIIAPEGVIHKCGICLLEIEHDLVFCPSCIAAFHFNHISSWILEKKQCPVCKTPLDFVE